MLPTDLPETMPEFLARFGTDPACRDYLFQRRWPDGFHARTADIIAAISSPARSMSASAHAAAPKSPFSPGRYSSRPRPGSRNGFWGPVPALVGNR